MELWRLSSLPLVCHRHSHHPDLGMGLWPVMAIIDGDYWRETSISPPRCFLYVLDVFIDISVYAGGTGVTGVWLPACIFADMLHALAIILASASALEPYLRGPSGEGAYHLRDLFSYLCRPMDCSQQFLHHL